MKKNLSEHMQDAICEKLQDAFDIIIQSKNKHYEESPQDIPSIYKIDDLIKSVSLRNAAISGSANLIPGPWGMLGVVPELILVIKNQIELIYDIGRAYDKKEVMTKELILVIFISAIGSGTGSLFVLHGGKYFVKRASLQVFQRLITILGGRVTQQAVKSAISKWLPVIGAAAMAAWANYLTRQIGKKAKEILQHDIVIDDTIIVSEFTEVDLQPVIDSVSFDEKIFEETKENNNNLDACIELENTKSNLNILTETEDVNESVFRTTQISKNRDEIKNIFRGQRLKLKEIIPDSDEFEIVAHINAPDSIIDFACFCLDSNGRLLDDFYMIFFNQLSTPCGGVSISFLTENSINFIVNLQKLPTAIARIAFAVVVDDNTKISQFIEGHIGFNLKGNEIARFNFLGSDFSMERSVILLEIYTKEDIWRTTAVGQGFKDGLEHLVHYFGGIIA